MMADKFDTIKAMYEESFQLHGDSPASLLTPKGRNELRFRAIEPFMSKRTVRVLDYGCGLGYLYNYLIQSGYDVDYTGVDILPDFISTCRDKYAKYSATFKLIEPTENIVGEFDIVFSSGVFNLVTNSDELASKVYAFEKLTQLFGMANQALICDFLSPFVDFRQEHAQHFEISEIATFCATSLTRRFVLRHDLLPYEFTLVAYRNAEIKRPENLFAVDVSSTVSHGKGASL